MTSFVVAKFGGTSVADYDAMNRSADVVLADPNTRLVVLSASAGVTNLLVSLSEGLEATERFVKLDALRKIQFDILERLQNPNVIREEVERLLENITTLAEAASLATSTALTDELVSHGELMSTLLFVEIMRERNIQAQWFDVRKVMRNYLPNDEESKHYACLLQWDNIYYQPPTQEYISPKTTVRVGLVQWQMRTYKTLDDLFEQVEFFVDAVSDYKSDFVLFPEYFNAPLMAKFNDEGESEAIRGLAAYTNEIRERFVKLAISYNINIITGSMPFIKEEDGRLYNVGFLCRRDGTYEMYEKIHVTPDEIKSWGLSGGKSLQTFDTDCAKIGVLICYDVEFPELSRIMADQGMQILFVPFLTDTQNAYSRVKVCAHARAIENECFVVIAGSVGNLPRVHNMDIQYAQSGVFTPCDFAFPTDGKRAEATPNTEMILVSDVDLDLLNELHTYGSVRNLKDRRNDLYEVKMKK